MIVFSQLLSYFLSFPSGLDHAELPILISCKWAAPSQQVFNPNPADFQGVGTTMHYFVSILC
jgi:hypothetical protein